MMKQSLALMGLLTIPLMSHAAPVDIGGTNYNLSTITGTFTANQALLESQVWWENAAYADIAALAGSTEFGDQTLTSGSSTYVTSPLAALLLKDPDIATRSVFSSYNGGTPPFSGALPFDIAPDLSVTWLVGTEVPVPAAAWLFGSALIGLAGIKRKK